MSKRWMCALFVLAVCLGLCACEEQPGQGGSGSSGQAEQLYITEHSMLSLLYGQWDNSQPDWKPGSLSFAQDGTCTVDGKKLTWKAAAKSGEKELFVHLFDGKKGVYEADLAWDNAYNCYTINLGQYMNYDASTTLQGTYINGAHFDVVEVTAENWDDYFELERGHTFKRDAFGDFTGLELWGKLVLQEHLRDRYCMLDGGEVTMEVAYDRDRVPCELDLENETWTVGPSSTQAEKKTGVITLYYDGERGLYANVYSGSYSQEGDSAWLPQFSEFHVTRVVGTLYLTKDMG